MSIREKILNRFLVSTDSNGYVVFTNKQTKKTKIILPGKKEVFILLEEIPESEKKQENIPQIVKEGKGILISPWELYEMFSNLSEDERYEKFYGYDKRTHRYLESIKKRNGWIESVYNWEEEKLQNYKTYEIYANTGPIQCGQVAPGKFVAQFSYRTDIDNYIVEKHYFDHFPSQQNIRTILLIEEIEQYFMLNPGSYKFQCWECGRTIHWLDIEGDLAKKFANTKDQYCGC